MRKNHINSNRSTEPIDSEKSYILLSLLDSFFDRIDISSNIWLSIDLLHIFTSIKIRSKSEIKFSLNLILEYLRNNSDKFSILIVPSFSFGFPKTKTFNTVNSHPELGSFPNYIYEKKYPLRSMHPFYSFYVFGKNANLFLDKSDGLYDSVGKNSIFNYIYLHKFKLVSIGHHYALALSSIHQTEYLLNVNYRTIVYFSGNLKDPTRKLETQGKFNFYSRNRDICDFSGITIEGLKQLHCNSISQSCLFHKSTIGYYILDLNEANEYILKYHNEEVPLVDYIHESSGRYLGVVTSKVSIELYRQFIKNHGHANL
tara:strand:+ start:88 stop:1029 length:942 start_codon:yes stop_codon:yes gene_type:complete